jgi:two-component system cell cycle response regulator
MSALPEKSAVGRGARIAVIEDNPANLELMRYILVAFGHRVSTASDGQAGYDLVLRERPELVVCDLQLPLVDGFEIARRLKSDPALSAIPLIAVTALAMVGDREKVLASGFDGYISKPLEPQSFIGQVDAFLSGRNRAKAPELANVGPSRSKAGPATAPASGKHVVIVDDVPSNLELLCTILRSAGHEVTPTAGLAEARASIEARRTDLVISDFHLRNESGTELVQWLRAHSRLSATPFMFLSSTVMAESDRRAGLERGADRFLLRPIEPGVLLAHVQSCLEMNERD